MSFEYTGHQKRDRLHRRYGIQKTIAGCIVEKGYRSVPRDQRQSDEPRKAPRVEGAYAPAATPPFMRSRLLLNDSLGGGWRYPLDFVYNIKY